ncbi:tyrosine-type recombinase/integrase [Nonomuraea sp. NPDC049400]|uniref:tyrosine-type recombinase/integrase n=1 Tax=Nonomuraea sp. NPDC049400 TaxID=3364352 RepID=UPI0037B93253
MSGFYTFHAHYGRGPVINPVPASRERRGALEHRSPIEAKSVFRRARLRQRVVDGPPRAIPDALWDELFEAMTCDRDRALLLFYVTSGARASELLGVRTGDLDWAGMRFYVVTKGTRLRQAVPASPQAFRYLARYLDDEGVPAADEPLWRTRRGEPRAMSYWAMRRVLQRANEVLGTNWTLHDARHTAAHFRDLLKQASNAADGDIIMVNGSSYQRLWSRVDERRIRLGGPANIRVQDLETGKHINLIHVEDAAFGEWAIVEVLRHSGVRIEEALELTHLSIRQYQRPNGEVIALLVVAPSKSDRERVIPMSAELFAVVAAIIRRHTTGGQIIPLLSRLRRGARPPSGRRRALPLLGRPRGVRLRPAHHGR